MYVLGIDGGGTKTVGLVADENGNVFMKVITGPSNPNAMLPEEFEKVLSNLLHQIHIQNPRIFNQIEICFAGMAGVGESGSHKNVEGLLKKQLPSKTQIIVDNDAVNALYSGSLGESGIVQIAGTGAITLGMNKNQKRCRVGGWGYLFDDEGSGFYLGNEALKAVFKAYDSRGSFTSLTSRVLNHFQLETVPEIIQKIYGGHQSKSSIAPLSCYVVEEAMNEDEVAVQIVHDACMRMFHSIKTCHQQLFDQDESTIVVLSGGVFTNSALFIQHLQKLASITLPNLTFRKNLIPPVGGAIVAGFLKKDVKIEKNFVETFNKHFQGNLGL
ncbi:BadF/BadG/BcrA/BcrD ATPase family protein [Psychrobacillus sp. FSL H8-0483]|uniref:BadF/BadG/BcrA/BcrD ATPase family protein n=1 Tax=Psychrobacillus sp. FSL H8-0483 TaxID=2921389 RepID=UPI00315A6745